MKNPKALITGITGQDGSYLTEYLLDLGYEVHGIIRPNQKDYSKKPFWRIENVSNQITFHEVDLRNLKTLSKLVEGLRPNECYHLAANSFVGTAPENSDELIDFNVNSTHNILHSINLFSPECRCFFAGSSEMFGEVEKTPQDERTHFRPRSLYGVSKVIGEELIKFFRNHKNVFASTGILFNHESPRRGQRFVTRKISYTAAKIKLGIENEIKLGNIDSVRDWGFAGDFVKAMHACLQTDSPKNFVISTGQAHSVKEFLEIAFEELDLDYKKYLIIDPKFFRPKEKVPLIGNNAKAKKLLNWKPQKPFQQLVAEMVKSDLDYLSHLP